MYLALIFYFNSYVILLSFLACVSNIIEAIKILGLNKVTKIRLNKKLIYDLTYEGIPC